ncbi:type I polyketide synthase [Nocardia vinacea]|uniref:type I polyketide synthase n=1 Tax=Nocardia vinacea TaxID=96468 RepID=UPI0002F37F89|nr:type I polyketide synthase [Nocardia vinacea]
MFEPSQEIAIVGMACRMPGAADLEQFWRLLRDRRDAVGSAPADRPGIEETAGFLSTATEFDADFFGVSPNEARSIDPQQLLALELSWEALEDAGMAATARDARRCGVFVGSTGTDFAEILASQGGQGVSRHSLWGVGRGIIANRISNYFGFSGPSILVDSAQASSLVAVHLACESLRSGESEVALAGGLNLILSPTSGERIEQFGAQSALGACYTFDARADGFVRGEGGGMVVLKPLAQAVADGDRIHAVIRGSAVNTGNERRVLTAPSRDAQAAAIRSALTAAGVEAASVQYVELHGTGTPAGDSVEAAALGETYGGSRAQDVPLAVGSVKTNIGHLEGASGIAGLIKTVLSLTHRELVASLNFETPNPLIPLADLGLRVVTGTESWPVAEVRRAGVSSFGMGGTNAHVIVEEAPAVKSAGDHASVVDGAGVVDGAAVVEGVGGVVPLVMSARSEGGVRAQAARLREWLVRYPELDVVDVAHSLLTTRAQMRWRGSVVGRHRAELLAGLAALADPTAPAMAIEPITGRAEQRRVAFVFPGNGSQWEGMALDLLDSDGAFAESIAECEAALAPYVDWSLTAVLRREADAPALDRVNVVQPVLFAVMVSLARMWCAAGVTPDVVIGHSHGEIAAAYVAGGLSLSDAARVVALRSRALADELAGHGGMASIGLGADAVGARLSAYGDRLSLAAVNGPAQSVISGDVSAVAEFLADCARDGVWARRVPIDYASHSKAIERIRDRLLAELEPIRPQSGSVPFFSTVFADRLDTAELNAEYWYRSEREPIRFADAVTALIADGITGFVEASPHPVLTLGIALTAEAAGAAEGVAVVGSLRRGEGGPQRFMASLARAYCAGLPVDPGALVPGGVRVDLPPYAFQRRNFLAGGPVTGVIDAVVATDDRIPEEPFSTGREQGAAWEDSPLARTLLAAPEYQRDTIVLDIVREHAAAVLGHESAQSIQPDLPFTELGFDSMSGVELQSRLQRATGVPLPASLVFDHPTATAVARLLQARVTGIERDKHRVSRRTATDEPIAIVGIGARFPGGVRSAEDLWDLMTAGRDVIGEFPTDRGWDLDRLFDPDPDKPGTVYTRHGGFLSDAGDFDPGFFGISPREALAMDPQQRLLLETAWEALEDAGIDPMSLRGSDTSVFAGACASGYSRRVTGDLEGYRLTGTSHSVISGRVAYVFGLEGPAVTVDTACSSSLVALHLACQALRQGDSSLVLAGGVTVAASPYLFVDFSRQRGLSPDGRCKAFSADADGVGWSEGSGIVVLERLSDARRLGHNVLAVIRGSAVNQDGASNGLTAPNGPSQERVIAQALANAGISAVDVDVVEAHGTGTTLGDPIEAQALIAAYGQDRGDREPVRIGSLKSNIGHTVAAAGVAGVIKLVQAMRHEWLPRTLHAETPSPHVDWAAGAVRLLTEAEPWPAGDRVRRAGVSSFGISGTNAHLIVEEAPAAPVAAAEDDIEIPLPLIPLLVSGKGEAGLRAQAARLQAWLSQRSQIDIADAAYSLATSRAQLDSRSVVLGRDRDEVLERLADLAESGTGTGVIAGVVGSGQTAFLFTGQGAQRIGMGAGLYEAFPVFADALDSVCAQFDPVLERSLADIMFGGTDATVLDRTEFTQPALFAFEVALYRLLESFGVTADVLIGHSIGEVAAAYLAGLWSLEDACRLVAARGRLMGALPEGGAMLAIAASETEVLDVVARYPDRVSVAAVNAPEALVISGDEEAVAEIETLFVGRGRKTSRLRVSHAFHSHRMEPMLAEFESVAKELTYHRLRLPVVSNVSGLLAGDEVLEPAYWVRHVRAAVRFAPGIETLIASGVRRFLEVGPDAVLTALTRHSLEEGTESVVAAAARRDHEEPQQFLTMLARAHTSGVRVDWTPLFRHRAIRRVPLPTYAFQHQRYWLADVAGTRDVRMSGLDGTEHPLLGAAVWLPDSDGVVLTGRVSLSSHPWLADHVIGGSVLVPGTAFVELALHVGALVDSRRLAELVVTTPLIVPPTGAVELRVMVAGPDDVGARPVSVYSRPQQDGESDRAQWVRHATGTLVAHAPSSPNWHTQSWPPVGALPITLEDAYAELAERGYHYGPAFRGLTALWRQDGAVFAELELPEQARSADHSSGHASADRFGVHPALLDAVLHAMLLGGLADSAAAGEILVPYSWENIDIHAVGATSVRVRLAPAEPEPGNRRIMLSLTDSHGGPVVEVAAVTLRPIAIGAIGARSAEQAGLYRVRWESTRLDSADSSTPAMAALSGATVTGIDATFGSVSDVAAAEYAPNTVVWRAPTHSTDDPAAVEPSIVRAGVHATLAMLRSWLAEERVSDVRLVVVTRGGAGLVGETAQLAAASVWGLVRSAQSEHPERFVLVDEDPAEPLSAEAIAAVLRSGEPQVAVRAGEMLVPRLTRASASAETVPVALADVTVLITGGTGGLGALFARHLIAEHGVRRLVLTSRRGLEAPGSAALVAELAQAGADVQVVACDVTDRDAVRNLLDSIDPDGGLAVVHTAGVLDDGTVESLTAEQVDRVLAPKVDGAWHLHELTRDRDVSAFVVFSSIAGVVGSAGQSNYAAANGFLDGLVQQRRATGLAATSLAWGPWNQGSGMTGELDRSAVARWERMGLGQLDDAEGVRLFDEALARSDAHHAPIRFDASVMRRGSDAAAVPAVLRGFVRRAPRPAQSAASSLGARLVGVPEARRGELVLAVVREHAAAVLGHASPGMIDVETPFNEMGFDSLGGVEFRNRLAKATGVRLPSTLVFDYPTPAAVAKFVQSRVEPKAVGEAPDMGRGKKPVRADEPIAIVGMACRYPGGVASPEQLWDLVLSGTDAISEFPSDRGWDLERLFDPDPERSGTSYIREGGFLRDAADFDAGFFGIGPREASAMDPQQRLLLEVSWEALEHAGIDPVSLRGSDTGVYTGVMYQDYATVTGKAGPEVEGYAVTGVMGSVASGRVSYALGLEGPAVTVDTACSSSLVALHTACRALRQGESSLALVGGATVMATPMVFVEFSRQRGLARDARCKSFSAAADGITWAEGAAMLVVERLSDAQRLGHNVLAVVRGSAVNQDGASNGLTAPNGPSQERVIMAALADAGLTPSDVDAVEAHGTGTPLGDPIEANALLATYGQDRPQPLLLGSLKSNIGHSQAAAGVGGVIKMVQALRHEMLPKTLHVDEPSPHVDWSVGAVELLTQARPWQRNGRIRRAGVSSFGISGTNAHVILEEAPAVAGGSGSRPDSMPTSTWVLSGQSQEGLREQAVRLGVWLGSHMEANPADIAHSLLRHRARLEWRGAVVGRGLADLKAGLAWLAESAPQSVNDGDSVVSGRAVSRRVAFVFPGQGSQWLGMGAELLAAGGVFADAIAECEAALAPFVDWSLTAVLRGKPGAASLERVDVVQPVLFAMMVSLARVWRASGVEPAAVLGHSQGEIAAAVVAGGLSLSDGARVVALRSQVVAQELAGDGGMASVRLDTDAVARRLSGFGDRISVAAVNGPGQTVVSGEESALDEFLTVCEADGVWVRRIPVDYASHSKAVESIRDRVLAELAAVVPVSGSVPFFSTVFADYVDTGMLDAGYWYRGLRERVLFAESVEVLARAGVNAFIEVSPHPVLTVGVASTTESLGLADRVAVFGTLKRDRGGPEQVAAALAQAHCVGVEVSPAALAPLAARVALPTYAFQHRRYWLQPSGTPDVSQSGMDEAGHPLLGAMLRLPDSPDVVFTGRLSPTSHPWLADHAVAGVALLPGAALVELALHVGTLLGYPRVAELVLEAPLPVPTAGAVELRVMAGGPDDTGARPVSVYSRAHGADESEQWVRHAVGSVTTEADAPPVDPGMTSWPPTGATALPVEGAYVDLAERGYEYGPVFQGLTALWRRDDEVFAEVALPEQARPHSAEFGLHPALLDAALHAILQGELFPATGPGAVAVPFSWENVELYATGATSLRVRAVRSGGDRITLTVADAAGMAVAEVAALTLRQLSIDTLLGSARRRNDGIGYRVEWVALPAPEDVLSEADIWGPALEDAAVTIAGRRASVVRFDPADGSASRDATADRGDLPAAVRDSVTELTVRMQQLLARDGLIVVVTRQAVATHTGESVDLFAAAAWGLLRTAQSEHADRILVVDVDDWADYRRAVAVAVTIGDEPQLAVRRGAVHVPRLSRGMGDIVGASDLVGSPAWALTHFGKGTLTGDNLALVETPDELRALEPGQVRIALRAAGVNFRDVLITLGMVSDATAASQSISATICVEGAGVVLEVAPDVTEFAPGDRVFGFTSGAGSVTVTDRRLIARMPHGWSFAQAAAVPVVYATAYYGLVDLAGAQPGQTLLLHAATGGVGLATIQLARHLGLRLLPTTSRPKWDVLRELGFDDSEIADSRTLDFEQKFFDATDGRGVDIVLNSLTLEFVDASLRLLPNGGKFIEMGHLDERDPVRVAADHPGVDYHHFMLLDVPPDRLGQILRTVVELFEAESLAPSQVTAWDLRQAPEAFRHMSQARHIGKNVLTVPTPLRPDGTVLITGGTGGLGAVVARQLITEHGVCRLVLAGRRGPQAPGAAELRDELVALGAEVAVVACDAADRAALDGVLAAIPAQHPLTGVVHAAGVLSDGLLATMTPERIAEVMRPKVDAAWNLHEATKDLDLSMFVLYSSIAGVIGNPGQANYAAANVFLDALAQYRHVNGLPATSMAWGLWAESTGMTGGLGAADIARLRRDGFPPLGIEDGMALFDAAVAGGRADVAAVRIDRSALAEDGRSIMRGLVRPSRRRVASAVGESSTLAALVAGRSPAEQKRVVLEVIRAQAAAVLGHDGIASIAPDIPFKDIGFDSLSVMEFRNQLIKATGLRLPARLVFDYPTAEALAGFVYEQISPADDPAERIAAEIDSLTRSCATAELSPEDRSDMARRLTLLLRQLEDKDAVEIDSGRTVDSLDTADDRELFDFIDNIS